MTNFFEYSKKLADAAHVIRDAPDCSLSREKMDKCLEDIHTYDSFCVNTHAKLCELLKKAIYFIDSDNFAESIEAELDKLVGEK